MLHQMTSSPADKLVEVIDQALMEDSMGRRPQKLELTWFNKDQALIPTEEGKYGYTWVDPKDPRYCEVHALVTEELVRGEQSPKEEGVTYSERADLEPTEDNLLILGESGDVLEALTQVPELADKYVGQVKCVYIDPPFNTAQTFANYEDNLEHSIWLTMMRDRLIHLHQLLSDDGSIWVHLDDVENHRMRALMDEVFGAGNFIAEIVWKKVYAPENRSVIGHSHDSILIYQKTADGFRNSRNLLPRTQEQNASYRNPDNDPRGPWKAGDFTTQAGHGTATQFYTLTTPAGFEFDPPPGRCWVYTEARYQELLADNRVYFGSDGKGRPAVKRFLSEVMGGRVPDTWWHHSEVGHNQEAKRELQALFPNQAAFSTPKPERLLERVLHIATNPGDLVLDVFAGSGTTAAVAHKMGRRWVTCELVEDTMERFTRPRLEKVVHGEDPGGITLTKGERIDATAEGLPEGISAEDAQKLTSLLNKAITNRDDLKKNPVVRELKSLVKTAKSKDTVNWRGGGSFTVARLSPSCFDYDPSLDLMALTGAATGATLVASVAANLGFYLTPKDRHFDGILGRQHLAVVEGVLDDAKVDDLMTHLPEGHTLLIAATIVPEGVRDHVRSFKNGSRVLHIPLDLFTYTTAQEGK